MEIVCRCHPTRGIIAEKITSQALGTWVCEKHWIKWQFVITGQECPVGRYVRKCEANQLYIYLTTKPTEKILKRVTEETWLSRTKHGHAMLLVFFDYFSNWVELILQPRLPRRNCLNTTRENSGTLWSHKVFVADNGTQFTSREQKNIYTPPR